MTHTLRLAMLVTTSIALVPAAPFTTTTHTASDPVLYLDGDILLSQALGSSVGARDGTIGFIQPEDREEPTGRAVTAQQRASWAKEGTAMIDAAVKAADIPKVAASLRDHQRFTRE